jgi:hypothetical protein
VLWYRNEGTATAPKLAAARTLVPESSLNKDWEKGLKPGQHGVRAKICVTDWNGDGWLDLLLGDFGSSRGEEPKLTDADRAEQKKAQERQQAILKEYRPIMDRYSKLWKARADAKGKLTPEQEKEFQQVQKEMAPYQKQLSEVYQTLRRFQTPSTYHGHVWLFLRRSPEAAATRD